jgi:AcrR family transcriptional regulator
MARATGKSPQNRDVKGSSRARKTAPGKPQPKSAARKGREEINLEPQQARSRESLRKLLKAAAEVLGQHGVEGTTIPRIAAHAGLTPGAIYRRFNDKDALLETVILGILDRQDERLRTGLTPEMAAQIPLPVFAEQVVHSLVVSYRANAGLMRAMRQLVRTRVDTEFWKKACRLEVRSYERLVGLFLTNAKNIQHPEPKMAVSLGMMMVISTLHELVLDTSEIRVWKGLMPQDDLTLKNELTRAFLSYLGAT